MPLKRTSIKSTSHDYAIRGAEDQVDLAKAALAAVVRTAYPLGTRIMTEKGAALIHGEVVGLHDAENANIQIRNLRTNKLRKIHVGRYGSNVILLKKHPTTTTAKKRRR